MLLTDFFFFVGWMNPDWVLYSFGPNDWHRNHMHPKLFIGYFASPFKQASVWVLSSHYSFPIENLFIHMVTYPLLLSGYCWSLSCWRRPDFVVWTHPLWNNRKTYHQVSWWRSNRTACVHFAAPVATTTVLLIALISSGSPLDAASTQARSWGENPLVCLVLVPNVSAPDRDCESCIPQKNYMKKTKTKTCMARKIYDFWEHS